MSYVFTSEKEELNFYRRLHSKMRACIYVLNHNPYKVEWITENETMFRTLGITAEQVQAIGDQLPYWLSTSKDFNESVKEPLKKFEKNPNTDWGGTYRITNLKGEEKWVAYTVSLLNQSTSVLDYKYVVTAFLIEDIFHTQQSMNDLVKHLSATNNKQVLETLTKRQKTILKLIATGKTINLIAQEMHLSRYTIEDHKRLLFKKLHCSSQVELAAKAKTLGL